MPEQLNTFFREVSSLKKGNPTPVILAIVLMVIAIGLFVWQFALRPNPNAVSVDDIPAQYKGTPPRDPNAGPMPVVVGRGSGR